MNRPLIQTLRFPLLLAICAASFAALAGPPKATTHKSFKPEEFASIAVIVKPIQGQSHGFGMGRQMQTQSSLERLVEQNFMRVLMKNGYTLVSRTDLDAAMVEKGLDQAKMTDESYSEAAAKLLHVSALMVVSVDAFNVKQQQVEVPNANGRFVAGNRKTYYEFTAAIAAMSRRTRICPPKARKG
jgi:hypothetical protein